MPQMLQLGSYGESVKLLQGALNAWPKGAPPKLNVDGAFGPKTNTRVKTFQSDAKLKPDGIVGPLTWAQIEPLILQIKMAVPIAADEKTAGKRIVAAAETALATLGWTATDKYSPLNMKIAAAKCADPKSPQRPRQGAAALAQIFSIAQAPGNYTSRCATISQDAVAWWQQQNAAGTDWRNANDLPAWCGIFAVYLLRVAGFIIPGGWGSHASYVLEAQKAGAGGSGTVYRLFTNPADAFPGCIGVISPTGRNHHFIVTGNDGVGTLKSIDGNTAGFGIDPDPKMRWDCKSIIARQSYSYNELKTGQAYFLFPAPGNR